MGADQSPCPCDKKQGSPRTVQRAGCCGVCQAPAKTAQFDRPGSAAGRIGHRRGKTSKAFGDKLLFEDLNFDLPRGGIVGVIGPNGAGKTTLFKMIMGLEKPTSGVLRVGDTVSLSYVDQSRDALDPAKTVYEEIVGGRDFVDVGSSRLHSRAYVGRFNFKGQDQQKFVRELSGGERNRVHLAKLLRTGGNVMLLDEPTNDLDVETLRSLEEAIQNFGGCVVVSSHDRWFLDRLATHILAFEGESEARWWEGNFSDYEADQRTRSRRRRRPAPPPALQAARPRLSQPAGGRDAQSSRRHPRRASCTGVRRRRTHTARRPPEGDPHDARRAGPEGLEVHAVRRVWPLLALGVPVVGQHHVGRRPPPRRRLSGRRGQPVRARPSASHRRAHGSPARGSPGEGPSPQRSRSR